MDKIPSWLLKTLVGLGSILLLILIIGQIFNIKDRNRLVDDKHVVTISAQGKVTAKPDLIQIDATVLTTASTAQLAQEQNTQKMNKVIDFVKSLKISSDDIKTSQYNIYPTYDYANGKQILNGYQANQTITIKVHDFSISGSLLDGLTQNGVNQIYGVNYTFADPDALREQAREQALQSARDKANRLAAAAGVQIDKLVTFNEDQSSQITPIPYAAFGKGAGGIGGGGDVATPNIEPGTQDITANVTVTYSLK